MQPTFSFQDIVHEELLRDESALFKAIGEDIEEALTRDQHPGLRISDVGSCALQLWAKVHGESTLPRDPQTIWSRLMAGTLFGAVLGRIFKAGMDRRGISCELEVSVMTDEIPGHIDVVLPSYQHLYELKSNYNTSTKAPSPFHWLQAGMYIQGLGEDYTASVVMIQPTIAGNRPRLVEYPCEDMSWILEQAGRESLRLRRAAGAVIPPLADVSQEEAKWRCASCQYGRCGSNKNPLKGFVSA